MPGHATSSANRNTVDGRKRLGTKVLGDRLTRLGLRYWGKRGAPAEVRLAGEDNQLSNRGDYAKAHKLL